MTFAVLITLLVLALLIGFLLFTNASTDVVIIGSLVLLMLFGVLTPIQALSGFIETGPLMIGGLFVVAAGLRETGMVERVAKLLLGRPRTLSGAQFRLMIPVSVLSGFMNTTAIVAMYLPIVSDWSKRIGFSPSKLYMPLSFSSILGGQLSQIGTATNLVILGLFITWSTSPASSESACDWASEAPQMAAYLRHCLSESSSRSMSSLTLTSTLMVNHILHGVVGLGVWILKRACRL